MNTTEQLYVITPIFNPRGFESRIRLYNQFANYMKACGVILITVEVAFGKREYEVTNPNNPYHLQLRSPHEMWHKESSINLGIQHLLHLDPEVKKVAWIDADVTFTNPNWVQDTLTALDHYHVVQLFSQATSLGPNHEILWSHESAFAHWRKRKPPTIEGDYPLSELGGGHPGLAWAATIDILNKLGGLMDSCIHGCYDEQTEIYTQRGFIPFSELTMDDKVLSRSPDEKIEWGDVTKLYKYEYDGVMYKIKSESLNLLITPNHNMLYRKIHSDNLYFEKIEETKAGRRIPKVSKWEADEPIDFKLFGANSIENFVAFMGIWLSEGWTYAALDGHSRIGIAQTKQDSRLKIKELLDSTFPNTKWTNSKKNGNESGYVGNNKPLFDYLRQFGKCRDKYIPKEIKNLPVKYLKIFLDWFVIGDGNIEKKKISNHTDTVRMYTSSPKLCDDLFEVIIKIGSWASIAEIKGKLSQPLQCGRQIQSDIEKPLYILTVHKSTDFYLKPRAISKEKYKGLVYCCQTPHHTLLIKRGNRIIWCGNSGDSHMANALRGDVHTYYLYKDGKSGAAPAFDRMLDNWQALCDKYVKCNVGVINGTCNHYWHGNYDNRGYNQRWAIICHHEFDPYQDIYRALNGLYQFSGNKPDFEQDLRLSMIARNDDENTIVPNGKDILRIGDKVGNKTIRRVTEGYIKANPQLTGLKEGDLWPM